MRNLKAFNSDLQLFAGDEDEFENDGELEVEGTNDETDVVDPVESDIEDGEDFEEESEEEVVADPQESKQTPQENATFKKMRLKAEAEANKKNEARLKEIEARELKLAEKEKEEQIKASYLTQEKIWEVADEKGISEDLAREFQELKAHKDFESAKAKAKEEFNQLQAQRDAYKGDRYFDEIDSLVRQLMPDNPTLTYETLYKHVYHDVSKKHSGELEKKVAKKTVANIQDSMRRRSVPASGSGDVAGDTSILSSEGKEMANAFGNDLREIAKYVKSKLKKK